MKIFSCQFFTKLWYLHANHMHANHNEEAGKYAGYNNELYMMWYYVVEGQFIFFRSNNHTITYL